MADLPPSFCGKVDAVAAMAVDHHDTTAAVSVPRGCRHLPCFPNLRRRCVGLCGDQQPQGRAQHCARGDGAAARKVVIFIGGHRLHGHQLRETGFRSYFREHAAEFELPDTLISLETRQMTHEATSELLGRHADLVAIYCAAGEMEGAITVLREARPPMT